MSRSRQTGSRLTPARRRLLDHLLEQALERRGDERAGYLAECRQRAPRLSAWLQRLLEAMDEPAEFLERSARDLVGEALEAREANDAGPLPDGTRLGPWRVVESVGAGGMGEVYRAERADGAFEMTVAVKVIRNASEYLAELLEAERQVMARINHPAIARLLDGGVMNDGRPYLVMEWVDGPTLSEWMEQHGPGPEQLLAVFQDICMAVSAAHRQLVVHGDIKPGNLIVTPEQQVRLLDFGVSKLLDAGAGVPMVDALTPGFSAPEQLAGEPISTAADIYSLGALLHWMVHGQAPGRDRSVLPRWREYRRQRELQAVVDRATAAEPEARYATVNALVLELQRLCENLPVRAWQPSLLHRLGLWVRRHRTAAMLGSLVLASVLIGITVTGWQARVVALERDVARTEAALSEAVREHLLFLFREVGSLSEDTEQMTARELLDRTAEVAEDWLAEDPAIKQQVLAVLGEIMIGLHDYRSAEPLLVGFIEHDDEKVSPVLRSMAYRDLAQVYHRKGRMEDGFEVINRSMEILEEFPGEHPARLSDVLQVRGRLHRDLGRWDEAVADLSRARDLAVDASAGPWPLMARAENNLGTTLLIGGQLKDAARHLEAAEALWFAMGRGDSSDALAVMSNLAAVLDRLGRSYEAERRLRRVIETRKEKYGDSGAMAAARIHLGRLLVVRGQYEEADRQLRIARDVAGRFVGERTPDYGAVLIGHGELAFARGRFEQALEHFSHSAEIMNEHLGPTHPYSLQAELEQLGAAARLAPEEAAANYTEFIERAREAGPAARTVLSTALCSWSAWLIEAGDPEQALPPAEECLELRQALGLGGWRVTEPRVLAELARQHSTDRPASESDLDNHLEQLTDETHRDAYVVRLARSEPGETVSLADDPT
ncbi:tetratricopeptide repeat protein [Wenzhouxiangella sp. AB-CW3]|uniref:serine/threonine-protein kinase n=1 Tax=Wenzhouxiangella sp. AB-CW3 TaxID=2771012 RepID=UPI00168B9EE4|nr:serine/threonine-protein kinase [Wenzhouxiangella sp. AB-CW3]QOC21624.1 tetratricopeptide repeat protein [Wenzhouxiangella sp. AB-CW3]